MARILILQIALVGLVAQLVTFSLFITLLAYFGFRVYVSSVPSVQAESGLVGQSAMTDI